MAQCSRHGTVQPRRSTAKDRPSFRAQTLGCSVWPRSNYAYPQTAAGEWDGHAENEHFSLRLARAAGLIVPNSSVQHFGDEIAIVVERYDRVRNDGRWARIHQEDMCQALGLHPTRKY